MKICIYGPGAVGCYLAGRLAANGAELSVIARGANLEAIRRDGIRVQAPLAEMHALPAASDNPSELGPQDAVIVCVKAPALPQVAKSIAPLLGPDTTVTFVLNGIPWWYFHGHGGELEGRRLPKLDPDDALWHAIGPGRTLGGILYCACDLVAPGLVHIETARSRLVLGEPGGAISPRAEALAALLRADDFAVEVTPTIRKTIWSKLQMNLCSGLLGCLGDAAPRDLYNDPAIESGVRAMVAEAGAIAEAMGFPTGFTADQLLGQVRNQAHKSSIVQDLANRRPMEIDPMFTLPLEMARLRGIPAPTLDLLAALVRVRARGVGAYPK